MNNETATQFPCLFVIKVIGKADSAVEQAALAIVKQHCPDFGEDYEQRKSRDGHYLALTFKVRASSKTQMDALYSALSACKDVIMSL